MTAEQQASLPSHGLVYQQSSFFPLNQKQAKAYHTILHVKTFDGDNGTVNKNKWLKH